MPVDVQIQATRELESVARRLKRAGDADLRRELLRGINRAVRPLKQAVQDAAVRELPKRGGLNRWVADSKFGSRTRATAGRDARVTITTKKAGHDIRAIDRGRLRHPVFGNRTTWVNQEVKPGWFTRTVSDGSPIVRRELERVIDDVARKIGRRV